MTYVSDCLPLPSSAFVASPRQRPTGIAADTVCRKCYPNFTRNSSRNICCPFWCDRDAPAGQCGRTLATLRSHTVQRRRLGAMGGAVVNPLVAPWFVRTRPAALPIADNGASIGVVVFSLLWVASIGLLGFPLAAATIGVVMALTMWFWRRYLPVWHWDCLRRSVDRASFFLCSRLPFARRRRHWQCDVFTAADCPSRIS